MDRNEYNRICQCKSAKEIWRLLEITHEGTNQVKESKITLLVHSYEQVNLFLTLSLDLFLHELFQAISKFL